MSVQLALSKRAELTLEQSWVELVSGKQKTQRAILKLTTHDTQELVRFLADMYPAAEREYAEILAIERKVLADIQMKKAEVAALEASIGQ
jgi:hypothetical protein